MSIRFLNQRATIVGLTAALALTFGALTRANAGECPAEQRRPNGTGQPMSSLGTRGVADKVVTFIELNTEPVSIQGRQLRARRLDIQPGGVVPWHSHGDRPALLFITEGEITEYASTCATPIVHKAGEITAERSPTSHWWKNLGSRPVVIYAFDLFRAAAAK